MFRRVICRSRQPAAVESQSSCPMGDFIPGLHPFMVSFLLTAVRLPHPWYPQSFECVDFVSIVFVRVGLLHVFLIVPRACLFFSAKSTLGPLNKNTLIVEWGFYSQNAALNRCIEVFISALTGWHLSNAGSMRITDKMAIY